jgi:hypothetical protein
MDRDTMALLMMEKQERFAHVSIVNGVVQRAAIEAQFATIGIDVPKDIIRTRKAQNLILAVTGQPFSGFVPKGNDPVPINIINTVEQVI